jgi:hypothetical protein
MAKTYTASAIGVAFASNKSLLGILNAHASRKVRIYRVWVLNNQTAAVTGVLTSMSVRKLSALTGGTAVTPVQHNTGNAAVDLTSVTCVTNGTATQTGDNALRVVMWSGDEPAVSSASSDEFQCIVPLMCIWDSTGDSNIEPITLNQNEGVHVVQPGSNAVGILDVFIEFTVDTA